MADNLYPELAYVPDRDPIAVECRHLLGCDHVEHPTWRQVSADEKASLRPCKTCVGRLAQR